MNLELLFPFSMFMNLDVAITDTFMFRPTCNLTCIVIDMYYLM